MKKLICLAIVINAVGVLMSPEIGASIKKDLSLRAAVYLHSILADEIDSDRDIKIESIPHPGLEAGDAIIHLHRHIRKELFDSMRLHLLIAIPALVNIVSLVVILALCHKSSKKERAV